MLSTQIQKYLPFSKTSQRYINVQLLVNTMDNYLYNLDKQLLKAYKTPLLSPPDVQDKPLMPLLNNPLPFLVYQHSKQMQF